MKTSKFFNCNPRFSLVPPLRCLILPFILAGQVSAADGGSSSVAHAIWEAGPSERESGSSVSISNTSSIVPAFIPEEASFTKGSENSSLVAVAFEADVESGDLTGAQEEEGEYTNTDIKSARFNHVEPGATTVEQLYALWGDPMTIRHEGSQTTLLYSRAPFAQIDVTLVDDIVDVIVVHLETPTEPGALAQQINILSFTPAPIPEPSGRILGLAYPERAILFAFSDEGPAMRVNQILVESIRAEPFLLRAKYDFHHRFNRSMADLNTAISLDPLLAEAHYQKALLYAKQGLWADSLQCAREAVHIDPNNIPYHLAVAKAENENGNYSEALAITNRFLEQEFISEIDLAAVQLQLGNLLAEGPEPDYNRAIELHHKAIELGASLSTHKEFATRRLAKNILADCHMAIAQNIARGNFEKKADTTEQWLQQADSLVSNLIETENGDLMLQLIALRKRMAVQAALLNPNDPNELVQQANRLSEQLKESYSDAGFHDVVDSELRTALYHAVQIEHARDAYPKAMRYAQLAVTHYEKESAAHSLSLRARFQLGELYYLAGSMQAMGTENHDSASRLYENALQYISEPMPLFAFSQLGEQGAWFVSMGVTFWNQGDMEKAISLTNKGSEFMQRAADEGQIAEADLVIPYGNLATMHRILGHDGLAQDYSEMAEQVLPATEGSIERR